MHVYEALAQALYDNDIHEMFGVVGDANLFIIDSFVSTSGGRYVATSSEGGAVMAAFGYAQVSEKLGVATVTHGPGLTNTVTALVEAQRGRVPMLVIAGDTPVSKHDHIQDVDQPAIVVRIDEQHAEIRAAAASVDEGQGVAAVNRQAGLPSTNLPEQGLIFRGFVQDFSVSSHDILW